MKRRNKGGGGAYRQFRIHWRHRGDPGTGAGLFNPDKRLQKSAAGTVGYQAVTVKSPLPDPMRGQCSWPIIDCDCEFKVWLLPCNSQDITAYVGGWIGDRGEQHTKGNFWCPADDKQMGGAGQLETGVSWRFESQKDVMA